MSNEETQLVILCQAEALNSFISNLGFNIQAEESIEHILTCVPQRGVRAVVIGESALAGKNIPEVVRQCREHLPLVDVIIWIPDASREMVRVTLNCRARDVLLEQSPEQCALEIARIVESQKLLPRASHHASQHEGAHIFEGILAKSRLMWDLFETASQVANTEATVLILGETGTGKELLARAIHKISARRGRFVPLNCGAINETLVDSELFGHEKGAFTGAHTHKKGLFSHADQGTLFLDEIGNVPLTAQYHLLRTLQEGTIRPVGSHTEIPVDVRVIAATSNALTQDVIDGKFREDLLYRLDVIRLEIPPLRHRQDDLIFLFAHFSKKISEDYNVTRPDLTDGFLDALIDYHWPGNVRELENFTERLILTQTGQRLTSEDFIKLISPNYKNVDKKNLQLASVDSERIKAKSAEPFSVDIALSLKENIDAVLKDIEKKYLQTCLAANHGRISDTAKIAGISRRTLLRKLNTYGLDKMHFRNRKTQD